ncbi:retrovirus-related pol polyprotein from transposon TNT 1-94 [Tanacetum coccineum]
MGTISGIRASVDKKGRSYAANAPKLEHGKFNKWKKRILCYLAGMEPYYLKCIKDGPFQKKHLKVMLSLRPNGLQMRGGWSFMTSALKSIIISCLPDDITEFVISCVLEKETWTDLVYSFEGPSNTNENRIMDLKLEYQTFWAKSTKSLSQTYTCYKTLLNELANDGVNLSKHEINDFHENFDDEVDERTSEEYLRDIDIKYHERALLVNSKRFIKRRNNFSGQKANENTECYKCGNKSHFAKDCFSKTSEPSYKSPVNNYSSVSKGFQRKFTPKFIQSSSNSNNQADPKFQKDYKAEYKKMKAKLALLEASPSKVTQVKVLIDLADDELAVRKSHARIDEWVDITIRKVERLNPDSKLQNFNTGRILVLENQAINESLETSNTPESSKDSEAEFLTPLLPLKNLYGALPSLKVMPLTFQPHFPKERPCLGIIKHTKPETQDSSNKSVSGTVTVSETKQTTSLVPTEVKDTEQESKLNELTKLVQMLINEKVNSNQKTQESNLKIQKAESSKSVDTSKISQDSKPKFRVLAHQNHSGPSLFKSHNLSVNSDIIPIIQLMIAIGFSTIMRAKAKTFPPCIHYGFNDHIPDDCRNYPEHIREPIWYLDSGCSRSMTGVKSYLHKYVEQPGPKVKQIRTDNGFEIRNHELENFIDEKGISQNFSSPYTPKQNSVAERKNRTLIEAARTMERIPDISYFHVFGCPVFIHNHKDHLGKFDAKVDDGYFLGYSSVSKAFRVYNTRRQQIEETYHVTFNESIEAIRFTNTLVDEIGIDDSSRYPPDEFLKDDPSR